MNPRTVRRPIVPAVALASVVWLGGCGGDEPVETAEADPSVAAEELVDGEESTDTVTEAEDIDEGTTGDRPAHEAAEVLENPSAFEGEELTVGAVVDEVVSDHMILIASSDADQTPLPVLHDGSLTLDEGDEVEVSGTVRQSFEIGEAEAFVGGGFDDDAHVAWEGRTYIQADSIEPIDE